MKADRSSFERSFVLAAGGDLVKAEELRRLHFRRLALKSATARRQASEAYIRDRVAARRAAEADSAADDLGGDAA